MQDEPKTKEIANAIIKDTISIPPIGTPIIKFDWTEDIVCVFCHKKITAKPNASSAGNGWVFECDCEKAQRTAKGLRELQNEKAILEDKIKEVEAHIYEKGLDYYKEQYQKVYMVERDKAVKEEDALFLSIDKLEI
jgi:hypothetical protein